MRFAVDMLPDLVASLRAAVPKLGLAETAPHVKLQLTTGEVGKVGETVEDRSFWCEKAQALRDTTHDGKRFDA